MSTILCIPKITSPSAYGSSFRRIGWFLNRSSLVTRVHTVICKSKFVSDMFLKFLDFSLHAFRLYQYASTPKLRERSNRVGASTFTVDGVRAGVVEVEKPASCEWRVMIDHRWRAFSCGRSPLSRSFVQVIIIYLLSACIFLPYVKRVMAHGR